MHNWNRKFKHAIFIFNFQKIKITRVKENSIWIVKNFKKRKSKMASSHAVENKSFKNGRYVVIRNIGEGGFGIVYLALDNHEKDRYSDLIQFKLIRFK